MFNGMMTLHTYEKLASLFGFETMKFLCVKATLSSRLLMLAPCIMSVQYIRGVNTGGCSVHWGIS